MATDLKAYRDSDIAWREQFDPSKPMGSGMFKPVAIPPRTLRPSKPWGCDKVFDNAILGELRAARLWLEAKIRRTWPSRRGWTQKKMVLIYFFEREVLAL